MGKFGIFVEMCLSKFLEVAKIIFHAGRKLTACIFAEICFTILGVTHMLILKQALSWIFWICFAGVIGFFYGMNILGDHILGGDKDNKNKYISKNGETNVKYENN